MKSSLVIWRNCWRWRLCMWQIASFSLHPTASIRTVECTAIQYKPCTLYNVLERVDCKRRCLCGSRNYAAYEYVYVLPTTNCTDAVCFYANCNAPMEHTKRERERDTTMYVSIPRHSQVYVLHTPCARKPQHRLLISSYAWSRTVVPKPYINTEETNRSQRARVRGLHHCCRNTASPHCQCSSFATCFSIVNESTHWSFARNVSRVQWCKMCNVVENL